MTLTNVEQRSVAAEEHKLARCRGCGAWLYDARPCPTCAKADAR